MSIETLKQQARRHEQNEEWQKALDQYLKAIAELADDEQSDIGLVNRVGDLYVRIGNVNEAVKYFEQAVDLYREAFLPNNAIAVCKKIIRAAPSRPQVYLKIGQIRAEQGFLPDARTNFLTYAERMQKSGNLDESFRALIEFCDLAPDDVQVRITVADQMASHSKAKEAVAQLLIAYARLSHTGEADLAKGVEKKIRALDPKADLGAALAASAASSVSSDGEVEAQFGEITMGAGVPAGPEGKASTPADPSFSMTTPGDLDLGGVGSKEEEGVELPMMSLDSRSGSEEEAADEGFELPMMSFEEADEREDEGVELPMMSLDAPETEKAEEAPDIPMMSFEPES